MQHTPCDVSVLFGSFAMGIDRSAAAAVEQLVRDGPEAAEATRSPYGIEGEYLLCIRTRSRSAGAQLFEKLKRTLEKPVRAPVTISGPQGTFTAPVATNR